jgi:hypothetical protein
MVSKGPIFRSIDVDQDQQITLGQQLSSTVQGMVDPAGTNRYKLKSGTFGRAASITIQLASSNGPVQTLEFAYGPDPDYNRMLAEYIEGLGDPDSSTPTSAMWTDSETKFELWGSGTTVNSRLTDL